MWAPTASSRRSRTVAAGSPVTRASRAAPNSGPATAAVVTRVAHAGRSRARRRSTTSRTPTGIPAGSPGWARSSRVTCWTKNGLPPARRRMPATSAGSGSPPRMAATSRAVSASASGRTGHDGASRDEAGEQGDERVALGLLEVAPGAEDQHPGGREPAGQEVQELERRGVGPLQVLQDDDQRPLAGGRQQDGGELVEQPEAGRRGQLVAGRRPVGRPRQLGQEPGQRGGAGRQPRRSPASGHERPEDLHPGPVRRHALPRPAPAPHHPRAARLRRGRRRGDHRRLADAGLAGEQDQPAPPAGQLLDGADELGEHVVPPDEPGVPGVVHSP